MLSDIENLRILKFVTRGKGVCAAGNLICAMSDEINLLLREICYLKDVIEFYEEKIGQEDE